MDNELVLQQRLEKIKGIIGFYGEENFSLSFSGGKDSTVLHYLLDMALPDNKIPRVFACTGIELNMVADFVKELAKTDDRIHIIAPTMPIKEMFEDVGYPFKSKHHAQMLAQYQRNGETETVKKYLGKGDKKWSGRMSCPDKLRYQFTPEFKMQVSDMCCWVMKEEPLDRWNREHNIKYPIIGLVREEGGRRHNAQCLVMEKGNLQAFQPLVAVTKEWEEWFIKKFDLKLCDIYYPPYNFERTGCKGCPFSIHLQDELDILEIFFPNERKQCEIIWGEVYNEYRRIHYRLWE